jgi:hypothetical protein
MLITLVQRQILLNRATRIVGRDPVDEVDELDPMSEWVDPEQLEEATE